MQYTIQSGDTIATVTQRLGTDWNTLKRTNPAAIGRSKKSGEWIVKAGATVAVTSKFQKVLAQQTAKQSAKQTTASSISSAQQQTTTPQNEFVHVLQKGETIWDLANKNYQVDQSEILRLNKISNPNALRIGQQIRIPIKGKNGSENSGEKVVASWYGKRHQGRVMANGAPFDMNGATIAHRTIPIGTEVELENPVTGEKAKAVVTDRGPAALNRDVDLRVS